MAEYQVAIPAKDMYWGAEPAAPYNRDWALDFYGLQLAFERTVAGYEKRLSGRT
jgi:hypothetical protein